MNEKGIETKTISGGGQSVEKDYELSIVPDVLSGIQNKTKLTKSTILEILNQSKKLEDVFVNPQLLMDEASKIISESLKKMMIDGIKYEKISGSFYEMKQFENEELEGYLDKLVKVQNQEKTPYDHVLVDSNIETQFAKDLDAREDIKFYFKLPRWFKIETPIGSYNPDWAVIFEGDKKVYFVAETKGTENMEELPPLEKMKILCGRKHFEQFSDVEFKAPIIKLEEIAL